MSYYDLIVEPWLKPSTLLFIAAIVGIFFFFKPYVRMLAGRGGFGGQEDPRLGGPDHGFAAGTEKRTFTGTLTRGRLEKKDLLPLAVITLIYGAVAFANLGDLTAPQSFWRATSESPTATIDLGKPTNIDHITYYTGLFTAHTDGNWYVEGSLDGSNWTPHSDLKHDYANVFKWMRNDDPFDTPVRFLRITARSPYMDMGELAVAEDSPQGPQLMDASGFKYGPAGASAMFDERDIVRDAQTYMNSAYFDEIYHARTAYEHKLGIYPYENTHPPLGKLIIMQGINLFGMDPFGWRFMGTLLGVLMVPIMFILLKLIFANRLVATCAATVFAFDFMHFTQTRIATIDVYAVFFILLMYLFMWIYITSGMEAPFHKTVLPLFLAGLAFGLGAASKWTCFYAGVGLAALFVIYLALRGRYWMKKHDAKRFVSFLVSTLGAALICFIVVPVIIYTLSYIPYAEAAATEGKPYSLNLVVDQMVENQKSMFNYHANLDDTHPFESSWYLWPVDGRPILYYAHLDDGNDMWRLKSYFSAFGNPLVWWGGLVALILTVIQFFRTRSSAAMFIMVGFLAQFLIWVIIPRLTFIYHYFPSTVFLILGIGFVFKGCVDRLRNGRRRVIMATAAVVFVFLMFYPAISGYPMPQWYSEYLLKWIPYSAWVI